MNGLRPETLATMVEQLVLDGDVDLLAASRIIAEVAVRRRAALQPEPRDKPTE